MEKHSSKKILKKIDNKKDEEKIKILNESFYKSLNLKKIKEEEEKNSILKINQKWENEEKENLDKVLKSIEITKKNVLDKINLEKEEKNKKIEEIKIEENKKDEDISNSTKEQNSLKMQFESIEKQANSFLKENTMSIYQKFKYTIEVSKYIGDEMKYYKYRGPRNLISPSEAVSDDNFIIQFLGYFGSELSLYKITTLIEKIPSNELIRDITFKMILTGLATQRVYKIIVDSDKVKARFEKDIKLWDSLIQNIRCRIEAFHKLNKNEIYFFNYDNTNFEVMMIIYNKRINGIDYTLRHLRVKVLIGNLLNNIILSSNMFIPEFSRSINDWPKGDLIRGGETYYPPYGWEGFALKLKNKFGDNYDWLGKNGDNEEEWCVAFHGIGKGNELQKVFSIINTNLREGPKQRYSTYENIRDYSKKEYKRCGKGVYLTPDIEKAEHYAHKISLGTYNKKFQFAVQARVDPKKIRDPGATPVNWVLNGSDKEIRPYRLLVKIS